MRRFACEYEQRAKSAEEDISMAWQAKMEAPLRAIPEGEYEASVAGIRLVALQEREMVRIDFVLRTNDEWDGREVSGLAGTTLTEDSKLGRWVAALLGRVPDVDETITVRQLLRKRSRVTVAHKHSEDGKVFANAIDVLPTAIGESGRPGPTD